jgi:phosphoglycolate phosphatase-like HAD superfamily hydrolase
MHYRNIIFDFDGTLTDSRRDIAGAQLWALRQMGFDGVQEEDLYPLIGKSLQWTFERILPPAHHHRIPEAIAFYAEYYPPRALQSTVLFPGVRETLTVLRSRGHRLAVASTKKGEGIRRATEYFGITGEFERLQGSEHMAYKPAPDVILAILSQLAWDPRETVMVGDSDVDILAGRNAGVDTCAVTYGSLSRAELLQLHPDFIIDRISDLLPIAETGGGRSAHLQTTAGRVV